MQHPCSRLPSLPPARARHTHPQHIPIRHPPTHPTHTRHPPLQPAPLKLPLRLPRLPSQQGEMVALRLAVLAACLALASASKQCPFLLSRVEAWLPQPGGAARIRRAPRFDPYVHPLQPRPQQAAGVACKSLSALRPAAARVCIPGRCPPALPSSQSAPAPCPARACCLRRRVWGGGICWIEQLTGAPIRGPPTDQQEPCPSVPLASCCHPLAAVAPVYPPTYSPSPGMCTLLHEARSCRPRTPHVCVHARWERGVLLAHTTHLAFGTWLPTPPLHTSTFTFDAWLRFGLRRACRVAPAAFSDGGSGLPANLPVSSAE